MGNFITHANNSNQPIDIKIRGKESFGIDVNSQIKLKRFASKLDPKILCNFIVNECVNDCGWHLDKLEEFVDICKNSDTFNLSEALDWIKSFEDHCIGYVFQNSYFYRFEYLTNITFDDVHITKQFFTVFKDTTNNLQNLSIDSYTIADEIDIKFFNELSNNFQSNKLQILHLWLPNYIDTEINQLFTNYLLCSKSLKSLTIQLFTEAKLSPDLSLLIVSNVEKLYLLIPNIHDVRNITNGKFPLLSILNKSTHINEIVLDFGEILDDYAMQFAITNISKNDEEKIINEVVNFMVMIQKLECPLKKLRIKGIISTSFLEIYDAKYVNEQIFDSLEIEFLGKTQIQKLIFSKIMHSAKHIKIVLYESILLTKMLQYVHNSPFGELSLNDGLNNMLLEFGTTLLFGKNEYVIYKEHSNEWKQDIVIIESLNDANKNKLKQSLPFYFEKNITMNARIEQIKDNELNEEKENDSKTDDEYIEEDIDFKGIEKNYKLINKYDINTVCEIFMCHCMAKMKLISHVTDNETSQEFVVNTLEQLLAFNNWYFYENKENESKKEMERIAAHIKKTKMIQQECYKKQTIKMIDTLVTHFNSLYTFIGISDIKTGLYLVNRILFRLCADKIHKQYAKHLYNINYLEFNKNRFSSIHKLDIDFLKIDKSDLYPLSLLNKIESFRVGMVEYNIYDKITINDIKNCFLNWNKLISVNLWHLNDNAGSRYNGNPLNAELTNILFIASIKTLKHIHVAFYGKECMFSKWVKHTNKSGNYYKYIHHSDDKENEHHCIYPDFNILSTSNECILEHFSFWTRRTNQDIMDMIYRQIKKIKTINKISIHIENNMFSNPDEDMTCIDFKNMVFKWKNILTVNGQNGDHKFYGSLILNGITMKWFKLIINNDDNDWFWIKNCNKPNLECLKIPSLYSDIDDAQILITFMELNKYKYVSTLYLQFMTASHSTYKTFGKLALMNGFCSIPGNYINQVILTQIRKDNFDDAQCRILEYIKNINDGDDDEKTNDDSSFPLNYDQQLSDSDSYDRGDYYE